LAWAVATRGTSTTRVALGDPINEIVPYQNTESPTTTKIRYFTLDLGYDLFRAPSYKIAPFIGYNYFSYNMSAFGCTRVNFVPPQTCDSDAPPRALFLQEMDTWISWRLGTSAVLVVAPGLRLVGDFAYLPVVRYSGIDNHPQRAGEEAITLSPAHGDGTGVQVEGVIAYDVTREFSLGLGARYWAMQIPTRTTNFFSTNVFYNERFATEQTAVFAQGTYKFAGPFE
jgi:hypothetical protein